MILLFLLVLAFYFVLFSIAFCIALFVLAFIILLISSLAGFISSSITKSPLKGFKVFFCFLGTILGYFTGLLFLTVISIIFEEIKTPASFIETVPASLIGAAIGLIFALFLNLLIDKIYKLVLKLINKIKKKNIQE